jgi:broad specificity phosphatase PhoE
MNQEHPLVYIARHGETALNKTESFRGPMDVPLNKKGWQQANALKMYLDGLDFRHVFTSDKIRATDTAKKIMEAHPDAELHINHGLRAFDVGFLAGKPKDEENQKIIDYYVSNPDIQIPDGESLNAFKVRVRPLLVEAIEIAVNEGKPVLLVAHSSIIHETGDMIGGHHEYVLVEPGGAACIFVKDGKLDAAPIFKKRDEAIKPRFEVIT